MVSKEFTIVIKVDLIGFDLKIINSNQEQVFYALNRKLDEINNNLIRAKIVSDDEIPPKDE